MILNDKELEALIREEFNASTPDNFDIILEKINQTKTSNAPKGKVRRHMSNVMKLAWAAVFLLVLGTGMMGYRSTVVATDVIQIDVNPSIAIELNRYGDVVHYQALNQDGQELADQMQEEKISASDMIRGTVLNLIDEGIINEDDNAILISVLGNNVKRTKKLEAMAVDAAVSTQSDSGIQLKVYKQHLKVQDQLKELAVQYGISEGKAAFIQTIADVVPDTELETLSVMTMSQLSTTVSDHLGGGEDTAVEDVTPTEEVKESASPSSGTSSTSTPKATATPKASVTPQPSETVTTPPKPSPTQTESPTITPTPTATLPPAVTEEPDPTVAPEPTTQPEPTTAPAPSIDPIEEE